MTMKTYGKSRKPATTDPLFEDSATWRLVHSALDFPFSFTLFPSQSGTKKKEHSLTLRHLPELLASTTAATKKALPWLKLARFGDERTPLRPHPTEPDRKTGGSFRHDANVLAITGIEGDYDRGAMSPEEARDRLKAARLTAAVYTTPSHGQPGKGSRFRIVLPCSRELLPSERAKLVARLNGVLGGVLAPESFVLSQAFYFGGTPDGTLVQVYLIEGERFIDEADDLDAGAIEKRKEKASATSKLTSTGKFTEDEHIEAIRLGEAYHTSSTALLGHWAWRGVPFAQAVRQLQEVYSSIPEADRRIEWGERFREILTLATTFYGKDASAKAAKETRQLKLVDDMEELGEAEILSPVQPREGLSHARRVADRATPFGDVALGARHADRLRGIRLYVFTTGQWLEWTPPRWQAMTPGGVAADTKETSALILTEAVKAVKEEADPENRANMVAAMRLHGSAANLARMEQMAQGEPGMSVLSPGEFNAVPDLLAVENGVLDLRTGMLREGQPGDRISKLAGTRFDPAAKAPMFMRFLATILPDPGIRAFVQRAVGYTLTGSIDEEVFFVAFGEGQNGKSVFANIIATLLGEYASSFGSALVTRAKHENEGERMKAALPGLRLALVNETAAGDLWDSARIKELASREKMMARALYQEPFSFMPTAKIWIRTNHLPGSLDAGRGFWRRCIAIPFTQTIAEADKVPDLDRRIVAAELPGVLNWALAGAKEWASGGLRVPAAIRAEVEGYREDTDLLGQWIAERTTPDSSVKVLRTKDAFADYERFCRALGASPGTAMSFGRALASKGFLPPKSKTSGRGFRGVRLLKQDTFPDDAEDDVADLV